MAPEKSIDKRLEEFVNECEIHQGEDLKRRVCAALGDRHYRLVAKAAAISGERLLYDTEASLIAAYQGFIDNPVKKDAHCIAKSAIVRALVALDCQNHQFFLAAIRYQQPEPVWGGSVDTALDLRNASAMGLVGTSYHRAAVAVAELLNDREAYVRIGALRALTYLPQDRAEPLLRFKALSGDPEAEVVGECFTALMKLEPDDSVDFVAEFLRHKDPEIAGYAALALGESRHPRALSAIRESFDQPYVHREFRRLLVRAAVLQRNEPAYQWLLEVGRERDVATCEMVIHELAIYRANDTLKKRLESVLNERSNPSLLRLFHQTWETD
jgi:hypothetical protein